MNLGEFREWTKDMPDDTLIGYHAYYKGCALGVFKKHNCWIYDKNGDKVVVMNPDIDYDSRKPPTKNTIDLNGKI